LIQLLTVRCSHVLQGFEVLVSMNTGMRLLLLLLQERVTLTVLIKVAFDRQLADLELSNSVISAQTITVMTVKNTQLVPLVELELHNM
jgi:hypothetical protein